MSTAWNTGLSVALYVVPGDIHCLLHQIFSSCYLFSIFTLLRTHFFLLCFFCNDAFYYWSSICFRELGNHGYFSTREALVSLSQMNFLTSVSSISSCWYWWSCYLEGPEEGRFILRLLAALFLVAGLVLIRQTLTILLHTAKSGKLK